MSKEKDCEGDPSLSMEDLTRWHYSHSQTCFNKAIAFLGIFPIDMFASMYVLIGKRLKAIYLPECWNGWINQDKIKINENPSCLILCSH